jgi:hypothetical protein
MENGYKEIAQYYYEKGFPIGKYIHFPFCHVDKIPPSLGSGQTRNEGTFTFSGRLKIFSL